MRVKVRQAIHFPCRREIVRRDVRVIRRCYKRRHREAQQVQGRTPVAAIAPSEIRQWNNREIVSRIGSSRRVDQQH